MNVEELMNAPVRANYCDECSHNLDLTFQSFSDDVSGVHITVDALPMLSCPNCSKLYLPDRTRLLIVDTHHRALEQNSPAVDVKRKKIQTNFGYTTVTFEYDADDYHYIPGLFRQHDKGFLTPIFFNVEVLIKYDAHPSYNVSYASRTYGTIKANGFDIPFGINKNGRVVMWLGDIASLPEKEQYYLLSENVSSDHSIGSEFYDGQIECKFTDRPPEDELFKQRSQLLEACFSHFGRKVAHLDKEVLDLAATITKPVVDTPAERRHVADTLNKVYIESFDNNELLKLLSAQGLDGAKLGSLKRLQRLLEAAVPHIDVSNAMSPLYALYDLRVAYSHLSSSARQAEVLNSVLERLNLPQEANLDAIYVALLAMLQKTFTDLANAFEELKTS